MSVGKLRSCPQSSVFYESEIEISDIWITVFRLDLLSEPVYAPLCPIGHFIYALDELGQVIRIGENVEKLATLQKMVKRSHYNSETKTLVMPFINSMGIYELETFESLGSVSFEAESWSGCAVLDDMVVVGTRDDRLTCFRLT